MALDSSLGQGRNWKSLPEESRSHKWAGWELGRLGCGQGQEAGRTPAPLRDRALRAVVLVIETVDTHGRNKRKRRTRNKY